MRSTVWIAVAAACALATNAAAAPKQFDLACSGTAKTVGGEQASPWSMELSLDMGTRTWCEPGCQSAHPIVRVEPTDVWLLSDAGAASKDPTAPMMRVDRITGQLTARNSAGQ